MRIRPILMSGPMVRATLDDRKTNTRRVLNPQPASVDENGRWYRMPSGGQSLNCYDIPYAVGDRLWVRENHYLTDDGHEEFAVFAADAKAVKDHVERIDALPTWFDEKLKAKHKRLRPSIHLPRVFSRLALDVTAVKVERIQDISEEDAIAESVRRVERAGLKGFEYHGEHWLSFGDGENAVAWPTAVESFSQLWDILNAKPRPRYGKDDAGRKVITHYESFPWDGGKHGDAPRTETHRGKPHIITPNPWVGAYSFKHHVCNVDQMPEAGAA